MILVSELKEYIKELDKSDLNKYKIYFNNMNGNKGRRNIVLKLMNGGKKNSKDSLEKTKNVSKRKNSDYQFTELLMVLMLLGLKDKNTYEDIIKFSNEMFENTKLKCKNKEILEKYYSDLKYSFDKKTFKQSYIDNFIKKLESYTELDLNKIDYVYLTGKSYSDYPEIVEQNKMFEGMKPNSDVYFKLKDQELLWGISCKQTSGCPCTNKVVEQKKKHLMELREKLLNDHNITIDNYKGKRDKGGEISKILCNTYCINGELQEYWKELQKHIIDGKEYFIQGVIDSMCQGDLLPYPVYEYDGEELLNTKDRKLEREKCDIRVSNIFCWGIRGPRNASKIWFDFMYDGDIKYNLEVRFKGVYFGEGGQPQLFIYKEKKEDIDKYIETRGKYYNSNNS